MYKKVAFQLELFAGYIKDVKFVKDTYTSYVFAEVEYFDLTFES